MISLLRTRRFLPLFVTQFLGAFNDNLFKNALVMLIAYRTESMTGAQVQMLLTMSAALFILPYLIFSSVVGQLSDKYDRARIARIVKLVEIVLMAIASVGFLTHSVYFLLFVLFCMGAHSTFFGTIKYALLPQHLYDNELIAGNAYVEGGTFLAILLGTILGGILIMQPGGPWLISFAVLACALGGYMASRHIPVAPPPMPELTIGWNLFSETVRLVNQSRTNRRVFLSILGISWFWLLGATYLSQFPAYAKDILHGDETVVTLFLTVFSVGIGVGSMLCTKLLRGVISSAYVPLGALGMALFTADLYFASPIPYTGEGVYMGAMEFLVQASHWRILLDLFGVAISGGLYIVPLYTIMQHDSAPEFRARIIAANNVMNALFMVVAAIATIAMLKAQFTIPQVFLTMAVLNGGVVVLVKKLRKPA